MIEPVLAAFQQWLLFAGVSFGVGCVAWRVVVAPGAMRLLSGAHAPALAEIERRTAVAGVVTSLVLLGAWVLRMVVQVMGFRDPFVPLWDDLSFLLFETFWGAVWVAQGVIIPLLAIAFWLAATRRGVAQSGLSGATMRQGVTPGTGTGRQARNLGKLSLPWLAAAVLVLLLVASLALSSHAMGAESWRLLIVTADGVHALAAGAWIGALGLILTVGRPSSDTQSGLDLFAAQIRSFSPLAIVSVAALLAMGIVLTWTHLTRVSDLWTMNYGRILSAKIALTGGVLAAGYVNWQKGIPTLSTESGSKATWRRAALEVFMAIGVLLLTALLVHAVKPTTAG